MRRSTLEAQAFSLCGEREMNPAILRLRKALEDLERVRDEVVPPAFGIIEYESCCHAEEYEKIVSRISAAIALSRSLLFIVEQETEIERIKVNQHAIRGRYVRS